MDAPTDSRACSRCRRAYMLQAMYYARSANHDVRALHTLVHHAAQTVAPRMVCKKVRSLCGAIVSPLGPHDAQTSVASFSKTMRLLVLFASVALFTFGVTQTYPDSWFMRNFQRKRTHYY